jgi:ETC complex I subunit conserved region
MKHKVKIYQPTKTAMSSGRAKMKRWKLEFEKTHSNFIDPLMGWVGQRDTQQQLNLYFDSAEDAVAYAEEEGLEYRVIQPQQKQFIKKSYADNFKFDAVRKHN